MLIGDWWSLLLGGIVSLLLQDCLVLLRVVRAGLPRVVRLPLHRLRLRLRRPHLMLCHTLHRVCPLLWRLAGSSNLRGCRHGVARLLHLRSDGVHFDRGWRLLLLLDRGCRSYLRGTLLLTLMLLVPCMLLARMQLPRLLLLTMLMLLTVVLYRHLLSQGRHRIHMR